jgi:hypothetical protein
MTTVIQALTLLDIIARGNQQANVTELDRLSFVVQNIDMECSIVPFNSFKSTPNGELVKNLGYKGMSSDQLSLDNFRHFRNIPEELKIRKMVEQGDGYVNFLEGLDNDLPKGRWSLKIDHSKLKVLFGLKIGLCDFFVLAWFRGLLQSQLQLVRLCLLR